MDVYSSKYGDNMFWRPSGVWNRAVGSRQLSALSSILGYAAQPDTMTPGPFRGSPRLDVDLIIKYDDILEICYGDTSWEKNRWYDNIWYNYFGGWKYGGTYKTYNLIGQWLLPMCF